MLHSNSGRFRSEQALRTRNIMRSSSRVSTITTGVVELKRIFRRARQSSV
jgi:hypothetical protein